MIYYVLGPILNYPHPEANLTVFTDPANEGYELPHLRVFTYATLARAIRGAKLCGKLFGGEWAITAPKNVVVNAIDQESTLLKATEMGEVLPV